MNLIGVRKLIKALPGTQEGTSYGTPAWKTSRKLIVRMLEDGKSMVVKIDRDDRELLVKAKPEVFSVTPHYQNYPWVVIVLAKVDKEDLGGLLVEAWRDVAPRKHLAAYEANSARDS